MSEQNQKQGPDHGREPRRPGNELALAPRWIFFANRLVRLPTTAEMVIIADWLANDGFQPAVGFAQDMRKIFTKQNEYLTAGGAQ